MSEFLETKQESEDNELLISTQKLAKDQTTTSEVATSQAATSQTATSQTSTFARQGYNMGNYSQMLRALSYCDDKPIFPYVVSVVGHRDCCLEENESTDGYRYTKEQVKKAFREQLQGLVTAWNEKCGKRTPFIVLTGMADGSDQIAAEVALEMHDQGVRVLAVLPMKNEFFRITVKNKTKLDDLLKKIKTQDGGQQNDEYVFELPFVKKNSEGDLVEDAELDKFAREFIKKYKGKLDSLTEKSFIQLSLSEIKDVKMAGNSRQNKDLEQIITDSIEQSSEMESPSSDNKTFSTNPQRLISHFAIGKFGEDEKKRLRRLFHTRFVFQCQRLADFLAVHSHVLFAFWDGLSATGMGGAATAVKFKLQGNLSYLSDCDYLTYPSVGLVAHIFTPRKNMGITYDYSAAPFSLGTKDTPPVFLWSRQELVDENGCPRVPTHIDMTAENTCKGLFAEEKYLAEVFERLGKLNNCIYRCYADIGRKRNNSIVELFSDDNSTKESIYKVKEKPETKRKNEEKIDAEAEKIRNNVELETGVLLDHYAIVDQLAMKFQTKMNSIIKWYIGLSVVFFLLGGFITVAGGVLSNTNYADGNTSFWGIFSKFSPCHSLLVFIAGLIYLIAILLIVFCYFSSSDNQYHLTFHRCRCMAEALRVQIFWRIAGIGDCASGYYHSHQTLKTDWLRTGLLGLDVLFKSPTGKTSFEHVRKHWCISQTKYFNNTSKKRVKQAGGDKLDKKLLLRVAFILLASQPIYSEYISWCSQSLRGFGLLYILIMAMFPGLFVSLLTRKAMRIQLNRLKAEGERYERAQYPFARATYYLSNPEKVNMTKRILKQLGSEALTENADWYLAAGERDLMLPR